MGWLRWSVLRDFGSSRVLRTSYFWLLFVPVMAKALLNIKQRLSFTVFGESMEVSLGLPFSWKIFYFSAVCFSIAGVIYSWRCHVLVKRYASFTEFIQEGRGVSHLRSYAATLPNVPSAVQHLLSRHEMPLDDNPSDREIARDRALADAFWMLRNAANHSDRVGLAVCFTFYALGFILLGVLLIQNFLYVVRATI